MRRAAAIVAGGAALLLLVAGTAAAQRPIPRPSTRPAQPPKRDTTPVVPRARPDTARPATGDTAKAELVEWSEPDSVMRALMARAGYEVTRYQGDRVTFRADERALYLEGTPGAVTRGQATLVGDTVVYNDSLQVVQVRGDTVILRDPSYQPDDVIARRYLEYDLARRIGTVRELSTAIESGQRWIVHGRGGAQFRNDTSAAKLNAFYVRNGEITSCEDHEPHYHFAAQEIKVVARNIMVARPAVLYIGNVPVMWLPFIFQDMRSGRRSGLLRPRFGVSELLRNSPTYRRQVDNLGYYFALSDYMDAELSLDWRSGARANQFDPGYLRYTGQMQYNWLDRFVQGSLAVGHERLRDGRKNSSVSWQHAQSFSQATRFSANVNWVSNTQVQQATVINPFQTNATIRSQAAYSTRLGPLNFSTGGTRVQYPGRDEVNLDFPSLNVSPQGPLNLAEWLVWTPTLSLSNSLRTDVPITGQYRITPRADGGLDSAFAFRDMRNTDATFNTPIRIFDFNWNNSFTFREYEERGPQLVQRRTATAAGDTIDRTLFFDRTFRTGLDWNTSIELPRISQGRFNIVPSVAIQNVLGSDPFWIRTPFSGGRFVQQTKRLSYGASSSPTIFGLFPGFGPISRLRHSITPVLSWRYSPDARGKVDTEFLEAANIQQQGFLGLLAQNQVSLNLSQNIEAKLRSDSDTAADGGRKIRLLSLNFSPLTYDFVRADSTGRGIIDREFRYDLRSDLLPGFDFRVGYSLWQGNPESDTAVFKPYRENVAANFSLNRNSAIFATLGRLLGVRGPTASEVETDQRGTQEQAMVTTQVASQAVAGQAARSAPLGVANAGQGWQLTVGYSATRPRPIVGAVVLDPEVLCADLERASQVDPRRRPAYDQCVRDARTQSGQFDQSNDPSGRGAQIRQNPPTQNINGSTTFNLTPKWAAQWSTSYDVERKQFGMHQVSLQRELHDWRAIFAFTQAPNGAFAFNFFIALNAEPNIKFDYRRQTFRQGGGSSF